MPSKARAAANRPLQVLIVEDSVNDAALLELELERAGYTPHCLRVDSPSAMSEALKTRAWDVIIADYVMPHFNGLSALALVKEHKMDVPFIIVSGHITDDTAVAAMKAGAHDYVMKDNLARLGPAVARELREAGVRHARRRSEDRLNAEHEFRNAIENSVPAGITAVDLEGRQTYVNPAFREMVGWSEQELVGSRPPFPYWPQEETEHIAKAMALVVRGEAPAGGIELRYRRRSGERINVLLQVTPLRDAFGNINGWVSSVSNITERKRAEMRLAAEHAITRILVNAPSLHEAGPGIIQVLLDGLEVDVGGLWWLDSRHPVLRLSSISIRSASPPLQVFLEESRRLNLAEGEGLPGRAWQTRKPVWIEDLETEPPGPRRDLARRARLHSAAAFPIQSGSEFFGALEFFTLRRFETDPRLLNMMSAIGSEIGQFVHRRQAEEGLRRAHDELETRVQQRTADLKLANAKLHASIADRKRLEHELLEITERERRRIGLDLHDDLGQKLSGMALMTKGLELKLGRSDPESARDAAAIHALVQEAMTHTSDLAHDLASLNVNGADLPGALEGLAERARQLFGITCQLKTDGEIPAVDAAVAGQIYKIAQEAVTNAIKHGKAKRVIIQLGMRGRELLLTIRNTGLPFPDLKHKSTGMGLRIMNYRAHLIGASLEVTGLGREGTRVTCGVVLEPSAPSAHPGG